MWVLIVIIVIFLLARHAKKKKEAAGEVRSEPAQSAAQKTASGTEPVFTKPRSTATVQSKPEAPSAGAEQSKVEAASSPAAPSAAAASVIEGLDYMDVRKYTDDSKRIPLMMAFAEAGDELAQYEVGTMYVTGSNGVEKNIEKGKDLLYKAGHGGATNAIAMLAVTCIKSAMTVGQHGAQEGLAQEEISRLFAEFYDEGVDALAWGISTGNEMSMDILSGKMDLGWNQGQLAETLVFATTRALQPRLDELKAKDDGRSNYVLGMIALRGICMEQDLALAKSYFRRGAELGDYNAREELKNPLFVLDDDEDDE